MIHTSILFYSFTSYSDLNDALSIFKLSLLYSMYSMHPMLANSDSLNNFNHKFILTPLNSIGLIYAVIILIIVEIHTYINKFIYKLLGNYPPVFLFTIKVIFNHRLIH